MSKKCMKEVNLEILNQSLIYLLIGLLCPEHIYIYLFLNHSIFKNWRLNSDQSKGTY